MARKTSLGAVSLEALNSKIDRKKLSLREQTLRAERRMKATGIDRQSAMVAVARAQVASQDRPARTTSARRKKKFVASGAPKRDPFAAPRKPTGKKVTRRGGRQPTRKRTKVALVPAADRKKKKR